MDVVFDHRWVGTHGIGRFASEVHRRLALAHVDACGSHPASVRGMAELVGAAARRAKRPSVFFTPGYVPPMLWRGPVILTLHDLIQIDVAGEVPRHVRAYFQLVVRGWARRAARVLTVSQHAKRRICDWADLPEERVVVVGNGVGAAYVPEGPTHAPGYPYVLYVGNRKVHKNVPRLAEAMASVPDVTLLMTGAPDPEVQRLVGAGRVVFAGPIPEQDLPAYYRGAAVTAIPSLEEGFGLPIIESLACGTPVVTSDRSAMREVSRERAILVDPLDVTSIATGIRRAIEAGRGSVDAASVARDYSWDSVGARVNGVLGEVVNA